MPGFGLNWKLFARVNLFVWCLMVIPGFGVEAAEARDQVAIAGAVAVEGEGDGEIVAIGGTVEVSGRANEELVAIGGEVNADARAEGETVLIGGEIDIRGTYAGELVAAGGEIDYYGANDEELVFMGGVITVHETAVSGGPAQIFGGELTLAGRFAAPSTFGGGEIAASGQFADDVNISGRSVVISGSFSGDLVIEGEDITVAEGAVLTGHLLVRSPNPPVLAPGLEFAPGAYTYEFIETYDPKIGNVAFSDIVKVLGGIFFALIVMVALAGIAAFIIVTAPQRLAAEASTAFRHAPGKSFLIGLVVMMVSGMVGALLMIVVVGPLLPIFIGSLGYFVAAYTLSVMMFHKVGEQMSGGQRAGYILLGAVILLVLNLVPVLGTLAVMIAAMIGTGALALALFDDVPRDEPAFDIDDDGRGDFEHDRNGTYDLEEPHRG